MFILGSQDAKLPPSVCLHVRTHACTHTCTYTPTHTHTPVLLGSFDTACFVPYLTSLQIPPACPSPTPGCPSLWPPPRRPGPRGRLDDRGCDAISPCRHRTNRCPRRGVPPLPFPARATWGSWQTLRASMRPSSVGTKASFSQDCCEAEGRGCVGNAMRRGWHPARVRPTAPSSSRWDRKHDVTVIPATATAAPRCSPLAPRRDGAREGKGHPTGTQVAQGKKRPQNCSRPKRSHIFCFLSFPRHSRTFLGSFLKTRARCCQGRGWGV